jgi:hypothetical protein
MVDYYTVLARKIRETSDDPAKIREVVYEAARLALRWQTQEQWPQLSTTESRRHLSELEEAIARLEADAAGPGGTANTEPDKAAAGLEAGRQGHIPSEEDEDPDTVGEHHSHARDPTSAGPEDREAVSDCRGGSGIPEPTNAPAGVKGQSRDALAQPEKYDAPDTVEEFHPQPILAAHAGLEAVARSLDGFGERKADNTVPAPKVTRQNREVPVGPDQEGAPHRFEEPHPESGDLPFAEPKRFGAIAESPGGSGNRETDKAAACLNAGRQSRNTLVEPEVENAPYTFAVDHPETRNPPFAEPTGLIAIPERLGSDAKGEPPETVAGFNARRQSREGDYAPDAIEEPPAADAAAGAAGQAWRHEREASRAAAGLSPSRQSRKEDYAPATVEEAGAGGPNGRYEHEPRKAVPGFKASRQSRAVNEPHDAGGEAYPSPRRSPPAEPADLDAADPRGRYNREPGKAVAGFNASRRSRYVPMESDQDDATEAYDQRRWDPPANTRDLILVPERAKRSTYLVNPDDFVRPDATYWIPPAPQSRAGRVVYGLKIASQLTVALLAVAAFYIAMWGRNSTVQTAGETSLPSSGQTLSARNAVPREGTTDSIPTDAGLPFPRPMVYGVYAIRDNQLVELEQVQATPMDPRTRSLLQLVKPSRVVLTSPKLAFVVFRRDLVSNAPEKVQVRIAAHIARSMNFDSNGKAVVTTPATESWLIRDQGYDLRVSPLRETAEMVMLRPENPEFSFPPGRYELMLGGQAYDFVVAGEVADPAHCVEGVATTRGPAFYECKPVL